RVSRGGKGSRRAGRKKATPRHFIARLETDLELAGVAVNLVDEMVEDGQCPRVVRGTEHAAGQIELREQVRLDRPRALRGRAADVRDRVQRVDVAEVDRLDRGR